MKNSDGQTRQFVLGWLDHHRGIVLRVVDALVARDASSSVLVVGRDAPPERCGPEPRERRGVDGSRRRSRRSSRTRPASRRAPRSGRDYDAGAAGTRSGFLRAAGRRAPCRDASSSSMASRRACVLQRGRVDLDVRDGAERGRVERAPRADTPSDAACGLPIAVASSASSIRSTALRAISRGTDAACADIRPGSPPTSPPSPPRSPSACGTPPSPSRTRGRRGRRAPGSPAGPRRLARTIVAHALVEVLEPRLADREPCPPSTINAAAAAPSIAPTAPPPGVGESDASTSQNPSTVSAPSRSSLTPALPLPRRPPAAPGPGASGSNPASCRWSTSSGPPAPMPAPDPRSRESVTAMPSPSASLRHLVERAHAGP